MDPDLDMWARRCIAEHLRRGKSWNLVQDVVSGHGLSRNDIWHLQHRVEEMAKEMADKLMYENREK
jgi:hypothetical protein